MFLACTWHRPEGGQAVLVKLAGVRLLVGWSLQAWVGRDCVRQQGAEGRQASSPHQQLHSWGL